MTTVQDAWGFRKSLAVNADVHEFMRAVERECRERGIPSTVPSDALDLSRDAILTDAAAGMNLQWEIVRETLRLWPFGLSVKWDDLETD